MSIALEWKGKGESTSLGRLHLIKSILGGIDVRGSIGKVIVYTGAYTILVKNIGHTARKETKGSLGNHPGNVFLRYGALSYTIVHVIT